MSNDFPDLRHDVYDFKVEATIAVEFQILSRNFKTSKKINAIKAYLFRLLKVYLVDNLIHLTMSTANKR